MIEPGHTYASKRTNEVCIVTELCRMPVVGNNFMQCVIYVDSDDKQHIHDLQGFEEEFEEF